MEEGRKELLLDLIIERYGDALRNFQAMRRKRSACDLECEELREEMQFLEYQIGIAERREKQPVPIAVVQEVQGLLAT